VDKMTKGKKNWELTFRRMLEPFLDDYWHVVDPNHRHQFKKDMDEFVNFIQSLLQQQRKEAIKIITASRPIFFGKEDKEKMVSDIVYETKEQIIEDLLKENE